MDKVNPPVLVYDAPITWAPVGLVTWYAEDGTSLALLTPWVALVCGEVSSVRVSWPKQKDDRLQLRFGGDFVVNLPTEKSLLTLRQVSRLGRLSLSAEDVLMGECLAGLKVDAPRLAVCPVQIECRGGVLVDNGYEADLCGEVVLLHRDGEVCTAQDASMMCFGRAWSRSGKP